MTITEAIHVVAAHFNHVERFNHQSFFSIATCNTQLALSLSSITLSNSEQQGYYTAIYPRHINFSKYIKCFTLLSLSGKLAVFILATLVSLHCNIHKNIENLAPFKISYLNQRKWQKYVPIPMNTYVNCNHYIKVSLCCDYRMVFLHVCDTVTPDIHTCIFAGDDNFSVQKNFSNQHSLKQTTVRR